MFAEVCFSILKQLNSCFKQISKSKSQKVSTFDALFKHAPKNFIARGLVTSIERYLLCFQGAKITIKKIPTLGKDDNKLTFLYVHLLNVAK